MKEIVLNMEDDFIHIYLYDYERFSKAEKKFLQELKEWIYLGKTEEPTNK